jgi:hypothetical protein
MGKNPSERTDGKTHTKRECYGELLTIAKFRKDST